MTEIHDGSVFQKIKLRIQVESAVRAELVRYDLTLPKKCIKIINPTIRHLESKR